MPSLAARLAVPAALLLLFAASASAANFTCTAGATCRSAIGYSVPNATTYGDLITLFNTTKLPDLLGANGLPAGTPASKRIEAKTTVVIPFRCRCHGSNVGQSDRLPVYVVKPQDGLDAIARNVFDAFVTFQEIAAANNIPDPNQIQVNQTLWIPLPCSCDQVDGADVMHLAYSVPKGDSTPAIAARYGVSENTLLKLNKINNPKDLQMGQILDVPLPVCRSSISKNSPDHDLLIPNGTYALTAKDCIRCSCSANTYQLDCTPVQSDRSCPAVPPCKGGLKLGAATNATGCASQLCSYSGYSNDPSFSIQTTLAANETTACQQKGGAARLEFAGSMWTMSFICFHMALILIWSL